MYPTYSNGFYNGIYYYPNGMPANRPPKFKRRKRFLSARNSHPSRSTETTTDYSDDDNGNTSYVYKRYNPSRHHHNNGWMYHNHHNNNYNYNQYHYSKHNNNNNHKIDKNVSVFLQIRTFNILINASKFLKSFRQMRHQI